MQNAPYLYVHVRRIFLNYLRANFIQFLERL